MKANSPLPQGAPAGIEEAKSALIGEIEVVYHQLGYAHRGRALETFSEEDLRRHLARVRAGELPWLRGGGRRAKGGGEQDNRPGRNG